MCTLLQVALSDRAGPGLITLREDFARGSMTGNAAIPTSPSLDRGFNTAPIQFDRLDDVLTKLVDPSSDVDLVKLDIEGHEDLCLLGGWDTMRRLRPTVLMEMNKAYYEARGVDVTERFPAVLPEDYWVYRFVKRAWTRIASFDECRPLDNVFLVPRERLDASAYKRVFGR
jgi:FkbM family methyltransferase